MFFYWDIFSALFIVAPLFRLLVVASGLILSTILLLQVCRSGTLPLIHPDARGALARLTVLVILSFLGMLVGFDKDVAALSMLTRHHSEYSMVCKSQASPPSSVTHGRSGATRYIVDPGPPVRVAFSWGGIVDNWVGVVFDPTGEVLKANEFRRDWSNWDDPQLRSIKQLFNGDMLRAKHLWGPWYLCFFT